MGECKCCGRKLHGVFMQGGEWYEAEIREVTQDNLIGYVRVKVQNQGLRTECRRSMSDAWEVDCTAELVREDDILGSQGVSPSPNLSASIRPSSPPPTSPMQ